MVAQAPAKTLQVQVLAAPSGVGSKSSTPSMAAMAGWTRSSCVSIQCLQISWPSWNKLVLRCLKNCWMFDLLASWCSATCLKLVACFFFQCILCQTYCLDLNLEFVYMLAYVCIDVVCPSSEIGWFAVTLSCTACSEHSGKCFCCTSVLGVLSWNATGRGKGVA